MLLFLLSPVPGGTNYGADDVVEYDLDNDDEDWLEALNRRQVKQGGSIPALGNRIGREGREDDGLGVSAQLSGCLYLLCPNSLPSTSNL
jgi:hypothetical protein